MSENTSQTPTAPKEPAAAPGTAPNVIAYGVSGAVGLGYGASAVSNDFYNHLRNRGVFDVPRDVLNEEIRAIFKDETVVKDVSQKLREANTAYRSKVKDIIEAKGFKSVFKRFNSLNTNHKLDIGMKVFTAAGISLGVMFAVTNSKSLFSSILGKDDAQSR